MRKLMRRSMREACLWIFRADPCADDVLRRAMPQFVASTASRAARESSDLDVDDSAPRRPALRLGVAVTHAAAHLGGDQRVGQAPGLVERRIEGVAQARAQAFLERLRER